MDPGKRDQQIVIQRSAMTTNDYGEEIPGAATTIATLWVNVRYGTGQEKREAAQEAGSQSATFLCNWSPVLETVTLRDHIQFLGSSWDITESARLERGLHRFTAVRSI